MTNPAKVRIDIVKTAPKTYDVNLWVFEKKTGRTVHQNKAASGISWKEAIELKRNLKEAYV